MFGLAITLPTQVFRCQNIVFIIQKGLELILDPNKQLENADKLKASTGNQEVDIFSDNFKLHRHLSSILGLILRHWELTGRQRLSIQRH